jgi:hypothetical protein
MGRANPPTRDLRRRRQTLPSRLLPESDGSSLTDCSGMRSRGQSFWRPNCFFHPADRLSTTRRLCRHVRIISEPSKVPSGGVPLETETKERWRELCEQIAIEQDVEKFMSAIQELNQVLEANERRRRNQSDIRISTGAMHAVSHPNNLSSATC